MPTDARAPLPTSPASERNKVPILALLRSLSDRQAIPQERLDRLSERLAHLEDYLPASGVGDLALDNDSIRQALERVWDGKEGSAKQLARLIVALAPLLALTNHQPR